MLYFHRFFCMHQTSKSHLRIEDIISHIDIKLRTHISDHLGPLLRGQVGRDPHTVQAEVFQCFGGETPFDNLFDLDLIRDYFLSLIPLASLKPLPLSSLKQAALICN